MLRLKQLRLENNMSQRALAAKIKSSQKAIDLWEKGITEPKASVIVALANVFECTTDYLLGREDDLGNVNVMRDLSESEKEALAVFGKLDKAQRRELLSYAGYLTEKKIKRRTHGVYLFFATKFFIALNVLSEMTCSVSHASFSASCSFTPKSCKNCLRMQCRS